MPKKIILSILTLILVVSFSLPVMAFQPQDVANDHWGLNYISSLLDQEIMYVYSNGNFEPNQAITRGEFAYSLARAMDLEPAIVSELTDISDHSAKGYISALVQEEIITGYPDQTFRPQNPITRAEIIAMLSRSLELDQKENSIKVKGDYYSDLSDEYWANELINLSSEIGMIDGYPDGTFRADNHVTRAESAKLLTELMNFEVITGDIVETYPISGKIRVNSEQGTETVDIDQNGLIGRNNRMVDLDEMLKSDQVYLLFDQNRNRATYVKAYGLITQEDLASQASELTGDFFSPDELISIADGDWQSVTPRLRQEVTNNLLEEGLSTEEVTALLNTDWDQLEDLSRERLIESISISTKISTALIEAAIEQDWDKAQDLARQDAINSAVTQILTSSSLLS
ncbi:S-layer homology domain-containing protein [Natroniella sp. ANB-PHB2]|uniref:S-layer homology domain-containing protein n=1 Tax=Natroniella sp. ANB-PHB2 TaxID=3384444 RepID=UPI0038D3983E